MLAVLRSNVGGHLQVLECANHRHIASSAIGMNRWHWSKRYMLVKLKVTEI